MKTNMMVLAVFAAFSYAEVSQAKYLINQANTGWRNKSRVMRLQNSIANLEVRSNQLHTAMEKASTRNLREPKKSRHVNASERRYHLNNATMHKQYVQRLNMIMKYDKSLDEQTRQRMAMTAEVHKKM